MPVERVVQVGLLECFCHAANIGGCGVLPGKYVCGLREAPVGIRTRKLRFLRIGGCWNSCQLLMLETCVLLVKVCSLWEVMWSEFMVAGELWPRP